jgi:mono/diheme cytochrome c family protein
VVAGVAAVLLAGCGGDGGNPDVAAGEELFQANCARCHGPDATGTATGPPLIHDYYKPSHHGDDAFRTAVRNGVTPHHWDFGPMPAIPGLDDEQIDAIIEHVRGLQRDAGIE